MPRFDAPTLEVEELSSPFAYDGVCLMFTQCTKGVDGLRDRPLLAYRCRWNGSGSILLVVQGGVQSIETKSSRVNNAASQYRGHVATAQKRRRQKR